MNKCSVNQKTLEQILSKIDGAFRSYLKNKEEASVFKEKIYKILNDIGSSYELDEILKISELICSRSERYGIESKFPDIFNNVNIINLITLAHNNVQLVDLLEVSTDNLVDTESVKLRYDASREFLNNAYGLAKEVLEYVVNETNKNLFDCLFINRSMNDWKLGSVNNNIELNRNIRQYQEILLKRITKYLDYIVSKSPNLHVPKEIKQLLANPLLYQDVNGEIVNTEILDKISSLSNMYLSSENFNVDTLRQLFNNINDNTISQSERDLSKLKLDAYNAKVILDHFDTYLTVTFGKTILINDFNQKTGKNKYQISNKTSNLITTWRVSDNIFVEDEIDFITKLAINTTPLIKWQSSEHIYGKYINFQDFEYIIAKIKDLVYQEYTTGIVFDKLFQSKNEKLWKSLSEETRMFLENKRLSTAINMIRRNPRLYLHSIFELLTNNEFHDLYIDSIYKTFTSDELNKLYSISKGIFNGDNSIHDLIDQNSENDYYSYITLVADAIFSIKYLQYYKDKNGILQIRTFVDQSVNNIRRNIELTINIRNSGKLIKDFDKYCKDLNLYPDTDFKYIKFTIPKTNIEVRVVASSGSVYFEENNKQITDFMSLWKNNDIKLFIDNVLKIHVSQDVNFQLELYNITKQWSNVCKNLLEFSSRVILNQYVSNTLLKNKSKTDIQSILNNLYGKNAPEYNDAFEELSLIHANDVPTLKNIALAKANLYGLTTSALTKDSLGNGQSSYTLSRLLGSMQSQFDLIERLPSSITKDLMLLTIPGLFEGVYTTKEFYDLNGESKDLTDMNVSEMSYAAIVHDFIKAFITSKDDELVGNGHALFLPSVNSDKKTIGRIRINLNKKITINGALKAIKDLSSSELEQVISKEFGTLYTNMYNSIVDDWSKLDLLILSKGIILPIKLSDDFINGFKNFNEYFFKNINRLSKYGNSPVDFIKHFTLQYNQLHRLNPLELTDQVHYKSNKGNLAINETIIAQIARFNPSFISNPEILQKYLTSDLFWATKKVEVLKTLIKSNIQINTSNENLPELKHLRDNFPQWIDLSGNLILAKAIVNGKEVKITSKRDLFKINSGNVNDTINSLFNTLTLNPVIELYNYLDYLFTLEFMTATVGSFIAHPPKGASDNVLEQEAALFLAQHKRNVSFTASMHPFQLNLLNGVSEFYNIATIEDIKDLQGTINGLINDIKPFDGATYVNPFVVILENNSLCGAKAGITKKQFVHFKNERTGTGGIIKTAGFGLTNDWIRNSPFLEKMMEKMTDNIWLNQDETEYVTDITRDFKNHKIKYKDFYFKENGKFYKILKIRSLGNNNYERIVCEVKSDGSIVENTVNKLEFPVNSNYKLWKLFGGKNSMTLDGRFLKLSNTSIENVVIAMNNIGVVIGNPNKIETQDQLFQPLKHSDIHYLATAGAVKQGAANINSANRYYDDEKYDFQRIRMYQGGIQLDKEHHADDSELSLMTQVMSACAAKGYTLDQSINLYKALRYSTEVNLHDHITAVQNLFTDGTELSIDHFQEILIKSIINALGNSSKVSTNFAEIIASDLIKQAKEGKKIKFSELLLPLSDNTVYSKIFSVISSYLTNTGIKLKIPGLLSVLTPSFNIYKLYAGRKYESFVNPELELNELLKLQIPIYEIVSAKDVIELSNALHDQETIFDENTPEYIEAKIKTNLVLNKYNLNLLTEEEIEEIYSQGWQELSQRLINIVSRIKKSNNSSNIDLGRTYFITYIDSDTNEAVEDKELIQTPEDYYELKDRIKNGEIISIVEDIIDGRDLAGYNVRFSTTSNEQFLLWDLDSAECIFKLNSLKKQWSISEENIKKLSQIYSKAFGNVPTITFDSADTYLKILSVRLNRMLQNDLENLSHSTLDAKKQYQKFLKTKEDTQQWYDKYAQWVNIKLGRNHGNRIYLRGLYVQVNSNNFDQIESIISNILDTTTKVKINGKYHTVDKSSISTLAYEIIMPKTFATVFGLKEFDDLETIKNDKDFFIKQYLINQSTKVDKNLYSIELKKSDGNHYYILSKDLIRGSKLNKISPLIATIDEKTYRLDSNQNIMYEITDDTEIYQDKFGNDVIVTNDLEFYINNLHYDSIKLSNNLVKYPQNVSKIIEILKNSSNNVATKYFDKLTESGEDIQNIMLQNSEIHSITLQNYNLLDESHLIIKQGRNKHTSFLKSLDILAARIPAQSMQSFMPMKIVAFDNPDINTAYVSTYLILLQGSDYDIDAVSLATYDIDNNGILKLWSPYSNISSIELMNASMELPFPSGIKTEILVNENYEIPYRFFKKYLSILSISQSMIYNKDTGTYEINPNDIEVNLILLNELDILLFKQLLNDINYLTKPTETLLLLNLAYKLTNDNIVTFLFGFPTQVSKIFDKLEKIVNKHNLYLDKLSKYNVSKITNNHETHSAYEIISDPVNLLLAQSPIDSTTKPLKIIADKSLEGKEAKSRTPGNAFNKFQSIYENQVGSQGIGICAVGLKAFFGLTEYDNYVLNYGNSELLQRLLLNSNHQGHIIGGKLYKLLANIRTKDPNSITNADVLNALSQTTNEEDAALILSALLSLATDNAKELSLSKLNASTKTLGLYIYGISIGMDFKDIAKILMSDTGAIITNLLEGDIFSDKDGYARISSAFDYFNYVPTNILNKFNISLDKNENPIISPLARFLELFFKILGDSEKSSLGEELAKFASSNYDLSYKLDVIENLRNLYNSSLTYGAEIYNQLIDFVQDYILQADVIGHDIKTYNDIKILCDGAEEMRLLGSIFSLNQGIKTKPDELLNQINSIERAIYNKTGKIEDLVDLQRFVFDEKYRQLCIEKYETIKHSFNIYEAISTVPHFMGYVKTLSIASKEVSSSYKFRSTKKVVLDLSKLLKYSKEDKIIKGVLNFIGDQLRKLWMLDNDLSIIIPKGNKIFDKFGNISELTEDTPIKLGTDYGDATFRMFMENEVIPNLLKGIIKTDSNTSFNVISENLFVKDLGNDLLTNTISRNPSIVYTLPINMLPRVDYERAIFNKYKAEFNKLSKYSYLYSVSEYVGSDIKTKEVKIPIVDLFTYYSMIAFNWKLGENSLVPILEDFQNTGLINNFHEFVAKKDKSGETLSLESIDRDDILPYIAPFESPYSSYANFILYKHPSSKKYRMMKKLSKLELEMIYGNDDVYDPNLIKNYTFRSSNVDTNYFTSGIIDSLTRTINHSYIEDGKIKSLVIKYHLDSGKIDSIFLDGQSLDIQKLSYIPTKKLNGVKKINIELLENMIKSITNPC